MRNLEQLCELYCHAKLYLPCVYPSIGYIIGNLDIDFQLRIIVYKNCNNIIKEQI